MEDAVEILEIFHLILDSLQNVRHSGEGYSARCPAHDDHANSLSLTLENDRILLKCHANCTFEAIIAALGVSPSELFAKPDGKPKMKVQPISNSKIVATYEYQYEKGEYAFESIRLEPKDFRQRHRGEDGEFIWNLKGVRLVPFNLPEVLHPDNKTILILEGEKDCLNAHERTGLCCTTNPLGALKWKADYNQYFAGKKVIIIPDNDPPGIQHAETVAKNLHPIARGVAVCRLPEGVKDFSLFSVSGEELAQYLKANSKQWSPDMAMLAAFHTRAEIEAAGPLSFAIERFYQTKAANVIAGLPGHGKTFVLLSTVKALLAGPPYTLWDIFPVNERYERVVYLIPEASLEFFKLRLQLMGLYDAALEGRILLRTFSKGPTLSLDSPEILAASKGAAVFLDTAIRFLEGDENSAEDVQKFANQIFGLLGAGAGLVAVAHHSPKTFRGAADMNLENMLRGSGNYGATFQAAHGVFQTDVEHNILHVENLKPQAFRPAAPFQIQGRPAIDESGDFRLFKAPGEAGTFAEEKPTPINPTNEARHKQGDDRVQICRELYSRDPNMTIKEMVAEFAKLGITVSPKSVETYRRKARKL